jgi:hypothetical protein
MTLLENIGPSCPWRGNVVGLHTDDYASGGVAALWKQSEPLVYVEKRAVMLT